MFEGYPEFIFEGNRFVMPIPIAYGDRGYSSVRGSILEPASILLAVE